MLFTEKVTAVKAVANAMIMFVNVLVHEHVGDAISILARSGLSIRNLLNRIFHSEQCFRFRSTSMAMGKQKDKTICEA